MARKPRDDDEEILVEDEEAEEDWDDAKDLGGDTEAEVEDSEKHDETIGHVYSSPMDRGGSSAADIAARLQTSQSLTKRDLQWNKGDSEPGWIMPRRPVQDMIMQLERLEHIGGYRRPRDVFCDWLDLVEATLHMLPQHALYARLNGTLMPPDQEPEEIKEVFKRVMRHYGAGRWKEAHSHFFEAYRILTDAAQGMTGDWLGAMYMAMEIGSARAGQYFTPMSLAKMSAMMMLGSIELEVIAKLAEAIDRWEGSEMYRLIGLTWGREHPNTTRWIWERHIDPLYLMTEHLRILEPASGAGIFLIAAIGEIPPWIVNYQLVDFYAVDIDPICAQMTRIQLLLYGANGYALLCQLPIVAPDDDLPAFAQLELRYQQIASHVQCANALSHEWVRQENGVWTMVPWYETEHGKRRLAEMEADGKQRETETAARKATAKKKATVDRVKQQADERGQKLLFDVKVPPVEIQVQAAALAGVELPATNGNGHAPGAAGDWTEFVERAKTQAGQVTSQVRAELEEAIKEMGEQLTQQSMF